MSEPLCPKCGQNPDAFCHCYDDGSDFEIEQARLRRQSQLEDLCEELEMKTAVLLRLARGDKSDCFERALGMPPSADCACHIFYAGALAATAQAIERKMQHQRYHHGTACGCSKCLPRRQEETREQREEMNAAMRIERRDSERDED